MLQSPTIKNYLAQKVQSAESEQSCEFPAASEKLGAQKPYLFAGSLRQAYAKCGSLGITWTEADIICYFEVTSDSPLFWGSSRRWARYVLQVPCDAANVRYL